MSLESIVQAALNGAGGANAYQDVAPANAAAPFLVWSLISSPINNTLAGPSNTQNGRLQIDCYAITPKARRQLGDAIETAMQGCSLLNVELSVDAMYEQDTKLFRGKFDYSIWTTQAI